MTDSLRSAHPRRPGVAVQLWGDAALFTRPEQKGERVSYPCPTPTAAVGALEAIYWHPGVIYRIDTIEVLRPIARWSVRRNETTVVPSLASALTGRTVDTAAGRARAQRMSLCLRDVAYRVHAFIELGPKATKSIAAYLDQFHRRVRRGACFSQPYLGIREFVADFGPVADQPAEPIDLNMGLMPHSAVYATDGTVTRWNWFHAELRKGVLQVPRDPITLSSSAGSGLEAAG
ncbi:type I-C CRISPR-associated protein Cas5 [Solihabitans fulvus]|uniref:pre-crRNA processing endonuclease n=1 Tax=Solihabitans fulvus TaxID=1892852 RepID=A0A5B2WNS6_9PSEU|nr:type I-C CRISPR-associated protein Cas5c [Solihabitans fulvus]KAA2252654.1 type I-C CRISPR-associated protein Cas5 [Solihabitans fulvus]